MRVYTIGTNGATFDSVNLAGNGKLVINGTNKIAGQGNVTKTGPGWMTLYGSNPNYTGNWTINNGVLEVGGSGVLGSGSVMVNSGGELGGNVTTLANPVVLNDGATIGTDFPAAATTCNFTAPLALSGSVNVRLGNFWSNLSQNVTFSNKLTGSGTMATIAGVGTTVSTGKLLLNADNSNYSGNLVINTGTVATGLVSGNALGTGQIFLRGGKLSLQGQLAPTGAPGAIGAISVSGFNKDTIYDATESAEYPSGDSTNNTLMDGFFSYFQNGFTPGEGYLNQGQTLTGGLASTNFSSSAGTPFVMKAFTDNNTLQIAHGANATLTLDTKAGLTRLAVLANAVYGADDNPNITINFADGTSVTTTYKAFDWSLGTDSARLAADAFGSTGIDRYSPTQSPGFDTRAFGMYESDIDLTNINGVDYSQKLIASLTFTGANGDGQAHSQTNIFAVSGISRANQVGAAQTYANPINVSADSSIDVSVSLNATVGPLSIGANKLSVTSADVTTNPYSLTFGATNVGGAATFDVANSAGGGAGKIVLGPVSGSGSITKTGTGKLRLNNGGAIAGALNANGGTVEIGAEDLMTGGLSITDAARRWTSPATTC